MEIDGRNGNLLFNQQHSKSISQGFSLLLIYAFSVLPTISARVKSVVDVASLDRSESIFITDSKDEKIQKMLI